MFGPGDGDLQRQISQNDHVKDFDVDPSDWKRSCKTVNVILEHILLKEIKAQAERYKGLAIGKYVKQGSSREGLKIRKADEFDTVLIYEIKGLNYDAVHLEQQPGLGLLKVSRRHSLEELQQRYPELYREEVFERKGSDVYLNSRSFHERVFESLIDSASSAVEKTIREAKERCHYHVDFQIRRQINAPSINLTFNIMSTNPDGDGRMHLTALVRTLGGAIFQSEASTTYHTYQIDVDVVPGLQINFDTVPNPFNPQEIMKCPVYAVFKWRNENQVSARQFEDPEIIWRFCTSGYEKHIMDVAQTKESQSYIMTAARLVKAYVRSEPMKNTNFGSFMKSYYLKNIALYCILYVTVINGKELSGVKEALGYFLDFLDVTLTEERLPHFFYNNEWIKYMFPDYELVECCKVDLFESARKNGTLQNAREYSWQSMKRTLQGLYQHADVFIYPDFKDRFREFITAGSYCSASC